SGTHKMPKNEV
ncbi:unnamed protein product, partial [Callosobruchus maculatus]